MKRRCTKASCSVELQAGSSPRLDQFLTISSCVISFKSVLTQRNGHQPTGQRHDVIVARGLTGSSCCPPTNMLSASYVSNVPVKESTSNHYYYTVQLTLLLANLITCVRTLEHKSKCSNVRPLVPHLENEARFYILCIQSVFVFSFLFPLLLCFPFTVSTV